MTINYEKENRVGIITLNRPEKLNAFSTEMRREFPILIDEIKQDDSVRVLCITGSGKGFCTGADLIDLNTDIQDFYHGSTYNTIQPIGFWLMHLMLLEKPVIAAVNGVAAGAGCSLSLMCDVRIASENAKFSFSFTRLGVVPDCASTFFLPMLIGLGKSMEIMLAGRIVPADEAEKIGLVNRVVPQNDLMKDALAMAGEIANGAPLALSLTKKVLRMGLRNTIESQLNYETYAQNICFASEDFQEGLKAFVERRPGNFTGR
ncbi:enoyl-CoA hydratase/isomerase family protein [Chloroflexota bacterium]